MAASAKMTKRRYNTPGVVSGNLARELDRRPPERREPDRRELERRLERSGQLAPDEYYLRRRESEAERIARERARAKAAVRPAQKVSPLAVLGFAAVAAMLVVVLLCYVQINAISRDIVAMKSEISQLEVEQVSLLTRYEQAFDLATVKEAAQAAGMVQPADSQVYYVDLPGEDSAVSYAREESSMLSRVFASLGRTVYAAVEYFR